MKQETHIQFCLALQEFRAMKTDFINSDAERDLRGMNNGSSEIHNITICKAISVQWNDAYPMVHVHCSSRKVMCGNKL